MGRGWQGREVAVLVAIIVNLIFVIGSENGMLHAVHVDTGKKMWVYKLDGEISWSTPALSSSGRVLYVGSKDKRLHAV